MSRGEDRPEGMIGGLMLLAIAIAFALPAFGVENSGAYVFVALGFAFFAAYLQDTSRVWSYLLPAGLLIGDGVALLASTWYPELDVQLTGAIWLATQAISLAVCYIVRPTHWWVLIPTAAFAAAAGANAFSKRPVFPEELRPFATTIVLAAVAVYLIARAEVEELEDSREGRGSR